MTEARVIEIARAKINLALHVLGRRATAITSSISIVAFADIGRPADLSSRRFRRHRSLSRALRGGALHDLESNLVLRRRARSCASASLARFPATFFELEKNLPSPRDLVAARPMPPRPCAVSSSSMASIAAMPRLREVARKLGADVPVCLRYPKPAG